MGAAKGRMARTGGRGGVVGGLCSLWGQLLGSGGGVIHVWIGRVRRRSSRRGRGGVDGRGRER